MEWFNLFGTVFMACIMVPNIIFAAKHKESFENKEIKRAVLLLEQIGRYGCFIFMIINVPALYFGFVSERTQALYLLVNSALIICYCLVWFFCFNKQNIFRAVSLSVLPSIVFVFSGIISRNLPLIIAAFIFAPCHIYISVKNVR